MATTAWWRDFELNGHVVQVRKTGARIPIDGGIVSEVLSWLTYHLRIEFERQRIPADGPRVWFTPDRPRPWYLIWPVAQMAGLRLASRPEDADLVFSFEDLTCVEAAQSSPLPQMNTQCVDVSKSRVAAVFEQVSGRALAVDPGVWSGPMVAKSELNGAHDGQIVTGPTAAEPGLAYQRLIDNVAEDGCVEDLRCPTVGGDVPVVFLKRRPVGERFANHNTEVRLLHPDAVFSAGERDLIRRFCAAMKLDWGGIDVLRDRQSGDLWIVDVNKTDMGPPIALPMTDKLSATHTLAQSLRAYVDARLTALET
ncbi:hypothetical protein ACFELO_09750 [Oceanicaulis sp. LC35]|uniref:hypothetical protein n=1 Tax=Oceanicaulis sp. LC35 TaxID=3349635 RepID=UPI003F827A07